MGEVFAGSPIDDADDKGMDEVSKAIAALKIHTVSQVKAQSAQSSSILDELVQPDNFYLPADVCIDIARFCSISTLASLR